MVKSPRGCSPFENIFVLHILSEVIEEIGLERLKSSNREDERPNPEFTAKLDVKDANQM